MLASDSNGLGRRADRTCSRFLSDRPILPFKGLTSFHVQPGNRIELVASEPLVIDPVSIAFDEHLRLWVVEMTDYPNGPPADAAPLSHSHH